MRETFTSGAVGRAPGNRCLYPEADRCSRCSHRPLSADVMWLQLAESQGEVRYLSDGQPVAVSEV
jgi:hypothetical protein